MNDEDFSKLPKDKPTEEDRLPPHSTEAEQGVLGCLLLDPEKSIPICIEKIGHKPDAFFDLRCQAVYSAIVSLWDRKKPVEVISVVQDLRDDLKLESVGGIIYVSSLQDTVPSAANIAYYIDILKEKHALRIANRNALEAIQKIHNHPGKAFEIVDEIYASAVSLSNLSDNKSNLHLAKPLAEESFKRLEEIASLHGATEGIPTGFVDIDKITSGLKDQEMIVIAARPSCGKSSIALNIADHIAVTLKIPVAFFSLEMSSKSLMMRALCSRSKVSMRDIRDGHITPQEIQQLIKAKSEISNSPLYIDDDGGTSILQLKAKARRYHQQYGIRLGIVDYLQLLHSTKRSGNRQEEVAEISRGIKAICKDIGIPMIVLAQLNREVDKDKQRKPRMSDLRESGAIEADADIIGLLYKTPMPEGTPEDMLIVPVNLLIAKNRNGETDDVQLTFFKKHTRFESASKIDVNYPEPPYKD